MATDQGWDEPPPTKRSRVEDTAQHQPRLDDLLEMIPPAMLDQQCSEITLCNVAKVLTDWQLLRPYLEMSESDEDDITKNYHCNNALQKQKLLLQWRNNFGEEATHSVLVRAIYNMGNVDLARQVCQMVKKSSVDMAHTPSSFLADASIPPPAMAVASTTSPSASSLAVATTSPAMAATGPSPAMLSYRDQLRYGYRTHKPVMVVEWPPPPALKYISLAMIKKDRVERGNIRDEYIRTTIHGNMDDILHEKVPVEVDQLFSLDSDEHKVVLVEGAPGSGKSTFLWHLCQKWQSGELFQQFTLVLLVLLRDTHVHTAQSLADILPCVPSRSSKCTPSEYRKTIASDIEDRHGEGVLVMLDGWDEAPTNLRQKGSLIHDIIAEPSKCSLAAAAVVVSSRPSASLDIRKYVSTRVEVLGFTKERREEYVRESLQDKPAAAHSLLQQIESIPKLGENCHLPLNLVIITHTFLCSGNSLPSTYCQIVITLALSCLLRHIQKSTPHGTAVKSLGSFSDLPSDIREEFLKLCKLAYEGIVEEKYSFSSEDMREIAQSSATGMPPETVTFGLLQAIHSLVATGSSTVYHFLHLSLQELCAAYYISSLPSPETKHIKALDRMVCIDEENLEDDTLEYTLRTHFQPVCEFYSALTHLDNPQVVSWLWHIYINKDHDYDDWGWDELGYHPRSKMESFFWCLTEADNPDLTAEIIGKSVVIGDIGRTLASAIAQAPHLESVTCKTYFTSVVSKALSGKTSLKQLKIYNSHSIDVEHVNLVLKTCANLEHFTIYGEFGDTEVSHLVEVLNQASIRTLDLSGTKIGEAGIIALSSALGTNTTIQHLTLRCQDVGPHGQETLTAALSQNTALNTLELKALRPPGPFTEDDRTFFSGLKEIPSLTKLGMNHAPHDKDAVGSFSVPLYIKSCRFSDDPLSATYVGRTLLSGDLVELADILKLNRPPAVDKQMHIDLYNRASVRVDFKNMCFIYQKVSNYKIERQPQDVTGKQLNGRPTRTTVVELDLSGLEIGDTGATHLANVTVLEKLNISRCGIEEEGIAALSSALSTNAPLKRLDAHGNNFGDKGASHLAEALTHSSLQEIDISNCGIGENGMIALSSALKTNTTLKHLKTYGNKFGDKGASQLAVALGHTSLQEISISYCGIGEDGIAALSSALSTNTTLKHLNANDNKFGDKGAFHLAVALGHTSLQEISISDCDIGEDGMVALFSALSTNTTLNYLNVRENNSRDKAITALSSALCANTTLKHLDASLEISGNSRVALARALLQNTSLTNLNNHMKKDQAGASYCFDMRDRAFLDHMFPCEVTQELLKDVQVSKFFTSIKRSPIIRRISIDKTSSLGEALWSGNMKEAAAILELNLPPAVEKTLYIQMNDNTWKVDYGARQVLGMDEGLLKIHRLYNDPTSWSSLRELTLENTFLGSVGACLLAEILNETQIQMLDVGCCHIPEDGIVALSLVLGTNTILKCLKVGGNNINPRGQKALARALARNTTLALLDISSCYFVIFMLHKSFEDDGQIFFQSLKHLSLSVIVYDNCTLLGATQCYYNGLENENNYRIIWNLNTSQIIFSPACDSYDLVDSIGDNEQDGSSTDSTF